MNFRSADILLRLPSLRDVVELVRETTEVYELPSRAKCFNGFLLDAGSVSDAANF